MALHLVTGYKGTPHITAEDVGAFNAGIVGTGEYVLNLGNKFAASLTSSNTVKILDGDAVMQGRHISLKKDTYEELTINNGENGKNRNDLIVVRYTKNGTTGAEDASFAVIQGMSTDGTATDPEYTTGDILSGDCILHEMPLYRISLTGLTVGEPETLFEVVKNPLGGLDGLLSKGTAPLSSVDEDTPDFWRSVGVGVWEITDGSVLNGLKITSYKGTLLNIIDSSGRVTQFLSSGQSTGGLLLYRYSNGGNSWNAPISKSSRTPWQTVSKNEFGPMARGSYEGTGTYGASNMNKLSFSFNVQCVIICSGYNTLVWLQGMDWVGWLAQSGNQKSVSTSSDSSTNPHSSNFYWYSSNDANEQMNTSGTLYRYIGFGF